MHRNTRHSPTRALVAGLVLCAAGTACGPSSEKQAFASERVYEPVGQEVRFGATTAQRFRLDRSEFQMPRAPQGGGLAWTTPPGWSELPATSMRVANFRVAGDEKAECYLTSLSGEGGGLDANVNRWRTQMGQPPLSAQEIAALPRIECFGGSSVFVEIDGTYGGMSGDQSGENYRMVGLLRVSAAGSKFLKMVGPKAVIAAETEHFKALAQSFKDGGAPSGGGAPPAPMASGAGRGTMPKDATHACVVDDGMSGMGSMPGMDLGAGGGGSAFAWTAPKGWTQGPEKAMREVTFLSGEKKEVECYVTALGGDGGGLAANLNRWRQQMGQPALTDAEIAKLTTVPMLGTSATIVEIDKAGGGDVVMGAVCMQPDRSVFVKMLGPKASVEAQRAAFLEFCKSIRSGG